MPTRTKGCDLEHSLAVEWFDEAVPLAKCTPGSLFKFLPATKWQDCKTWSVALSSLLGKTNGRIPKQKVLHESLRSWLAKAGKVWSLADSEKAIYDMRKMLQCILKRKQDHGRAPRRYAALDILLSKMHISEDEAEDRVVAYDSDSSSEIPDDIRPQPLAVQACVGQDSSPVNLVSDDDDVQIIPDGMTLADLEEALFPPVASSSLEEPSSLVTPVKRRRLVRKTFDDTPPKLLDAKAVDSIVASSLAHKPPLPGDFRALSKEFKKKGGKVGKKGGKKKKNKLKVVLRKPAAAAKTEAAKTEGDVDSLDCFKCLSADDLEFANTAVASYLAKRGSVDDRILRHRLYSKLWHTKGRTADRNMLAKCGAALWDRQSKVE